VHEPLHASTLMPTGPDPVTNVASSTASGRPPLIDLVQFRLRQNQESSSLPSDPMWAQFLPPACSPLFSPCASPKASGMQPNITVGLLDEEIQAFHKTHRWDLVPKQPNKNVMGFKWVFFIKYQFDGRIVLIFLFYLIWVLGWL